MVFPLNAEFRKNWIFEHNSALYDFMLKKFHMRRLDLNAKKTLSAILEFSILRRKIAKFRKIRIFEINLALNYSMVKKFHTRGLDLIAKTTFGDFAIFEFNGENR